jgi:hypothetical protein
LETGAATGQKYASGQNGDNNRIDGGLQSFCHCTSTSIYQSPHRRYFIYAAAWSGIVEK